MYYDLKRDLLYRLEVACENRNVSDEEIIKSLRVNNNLTYEEAEKFFKTYYERVRNEHYHD